MADIQLKIKSLDNSEIQLSNKDIKSIESTAQSTGQPDTIYYGTVPSTGSVDINDRKGEFYNRIMNGELGNSNLPLELFANGKKVQTHIATDSDYDINGKVFSVDIENQLSLYENVIYEGYDYMGVPQTLYNIFSSFCEAVGFTNAQKDIMLSNEIIYCDDKSVGTVADYFRSIVVPYPVIEQGTVRETLDKFCTLAQLNLLANDNGDLIFVQARPVRTGKERLLVIPAKNQMSAIERNIIVKNKVGKATVGIKKPLETEETNVVVAKVDGDIINYETPSYVGQVRQTEGIVIPNSLDGSIGGARSGAIGAFAELSYVGYYEGSVVFPAYNGGTIITNLYDYIPDGVVGDRESKVNYKLTYKKIIGNVEFTQPITQYDDRGFPVLPSTLALENRKYTPVIETIIVDSGEAGLLSSSTIKNNFGLRVVAGTTVTELNIDQTGGWINETDLAKGNLTYNASTQEYEFSYKVLASLRMERLCAEMPQNATSVDFKGIYSERSYGGYHSHIAGVQIVTNAECYEYYIPQQLEITFNGDRKVISFEDSILSVGKDSQSGINITGNELLQSSTILETTKPIILAEAVANNIISDYKNGVSTCRVTVTCGDYADEYGVVRKHWAKGEIFQVGDIVRLDRDNNGTPAMTYKNGKTMLWKVTGRTFRHAGVPLIDLELQEIF